jgi:hypothetical protein
MSPETGGDVVGRALRDERGLDTEFLDRRRGHRTDGRNAGCRPTPVRPFATAATR